MSTRTLRDRLRQSLRRAYRATRRSAVLGPPVGTVESRARAVYDSATRGRRSRNSARAFWTIMEDLDRSSYAPVRPDKLPFPEYAVVEINNTCNINCLMCNTKMAERQKGTIKLGLLEQVLSELKAEGIREVEAHTIGDPLAHPKLADVLAVFRRVGMPLFISTNGLQLERHLQTLLEYRDLIGSIRFSIDGATPATYELIRAGGRWETLLHSLDLAITHLRPRGYRLSTNMTLSKDNVHEVGQFIAFFRRYFEPRLMTFGFVNSLAPDTSYFKKVNLFATHTHPTVPCSLPFRSFWVHIDGRVSSCCRDYHGELIVGDTTKNDIREIWNGAAFERLRSAHHDGQVGEYRLCANCDMIDPRIDEAFTAMMRALIIEAPNAPAEYYQEWVDHFVAAVSGGRPFVERFRSASHHRPLAGIRALA